jgi:hypothetical protein
VGLLFKYGEIIRKFDEKELADVLVSEVENVIRERTIRPQSHEGTKKSK